MVSAKSVDDQLKMLHYTKGWNRPETEELAAILLPEEEIFECVNGWYEGGYGLLCATNIRVLLIDKKPFKFLNVEDVRFDTINQIDYSHRMFNAHICITAGMKSLNFKSYNQPRLRTLISHVQNRMAEIKRTEQGTKLRGQAKPADISDMDDQLKAYLLSQYEQHQSLRRQYEINQPPIVLNNDSKLKTELTPKIAMDPLGVASGVSTDELYHEGVKEVFGRYRLEASTNPIQIQTQADPLQLSLAYDDLPSIEVNPLKVAYGKLPQILSRRRQLANMI